MIVFVFIVPASERTMNIYSSLSYHPLKPSFGIELDFRKNKYIRFDNKLGAVYYQKKGQTIKNWVNQSGAIVRTDTMNYKTNYIGLTYGFIPTLILWEKIMLGSGLKVDGCLGFPGRDFSFECNLVANLGYKFKKIGIYCSLIRERQIGAGLSVDISPVIRSENNIPKN